MPVMGTDDTQAYDMHGSRFTSYLAPARGSTQLCAWRLEVTAGNPGAEHRINREEVLYLLDGELGVTIDGVAAQAGPGDVVFVPAGSSVRIDGGPTDASAWVVTTTGLEAELADGTRLAPPWTR